jgi:hypothetical protein
VTVLRLAKGLGLTEDLIRVSEHTDWNEQRGATTEREWKGRLLAVRRLWRDGDPLDRSAVQGVVPLPYTAICLSFHNFVNFL